MLPTRAEWAELVAACDEAGAVLLADEVYRFLEYDDADRLPAGADVAARGVSLGVMSKSFAMAGLRIGWLATRDRALLERCAALKDYTTICSSAPSEILALIALRARTPVLARSRAIVATNLERMDRFFIDHAESFAWVRPRAGSVAFPRLLRGGPIDRFSAELVESEGVLLLPASTFGFGGDHFRLGLGRTDLPEAVERLEGFVARRA
jgi:aspartate/methionine/tyrosine aminotransferase